jgi:hypothetical protein
MYLTKRIPYSILDTHRKFVFVPNPKVCFHSIGRGALSGRTINYRDGVRQYYAALWNLFKSHTFMFTFVRNTWERVLSAFVFLQAVKGEIPKGAVFKDYIKTTFVKKGPLTNIHFREQDTYLYCGEPFNIFIGRFEQLEKDWAYVAEKIDAPKHLPKLNSTPHTHYSDYYDPECVEIIRNIYKKEIDFLGYEYEAA